MSAGLPMIPGCDFGTRRSAVPPVSEDDLRKLEESAGWTPDDAAVLRRHAEVSQQQAEVMVDSWREVIGRQPYLAQWFVGSDREPDDAYKAAVKRRFVHWVVDVALRPHDRDWLNYREETGLRHTPAKKNVTDAAGTPPLVPLRYLMGFVRRPRLSPALSPFRRGFCPLPQWLE